MDEIKLSEESYLPIIEEFDMKFDSSASDNIRAIWAYTIALMQTSIEKEGNHPGVIIFDEPNQHSIIPEDMCMRLMHLKNYLNVKLVTQYRIFNNRRWSVSEKFI